MPIAADALLVARALKWGNISQVREALEGILRSLEAFGHVVAAGGRYSFEAEFRHWRFGRVRFQSSQAAFAAAGPCLGTGPRCDYLEDRERRGPEVRRPRLERRRIGRRALPFHERAPGVRDFWRGVFARASPQLTHR